MDSEEQKIEGAEVEATPAMDEEVAADATMEAEAPVEVEASEEEEEAAA
jgi:hypothetical protein